MDIESGNEPEIPAADPQDGDKASSDSVLQIEAQPQTEPQTTATTATATATTQPFTAGWLLVFSPLKVRLNPSEGWTFTGELPPLAPDDGWPSPPNSKTYVGITDDQTPGAIIYPNQPVFLSFDSGQQHKYRLRNKQGLHVSEENVVFGPPYQTVTARTAVALMTAYSVRLWRERQGDLKRGEYLKWESKRLRWEAKFLEREWFIRGNREIFPPGTTSGDVFNAIRALEEMPTVYPLPN
ncbi:hypothetical protein MGYG_08140 [Nannizzia gypsea CBS 118893]|uniref:Uncharacterized protein n=1 Tax=Arthroderma gypseum (strain ATCC MYA-4604 / CBS 118893) TaxID=535722 RepID=E4V554_ARTGP|nr:hypothetical protein MGYG_08140 [Nannizzia gypsea CBS 118893]EFR05128.1 hypothetical protein MGYG_08140 [Nannizzia gypsea CBS 118893]